MMLLLLDAPPGEKPGKPVNLTVKEVPGGWVISWNNPEGKFHTYLLVAYN